MKENEIFSYKDYKKKDEYKIIQLFKKTFKKNFILKKWTWIFKKNPNGNSKIALVFYKKKLVGQCASIKIFFNLHSKKKIFYRIQNFMVDKNYRLNKIATHSLKFLTSKIIKNNNHIITFPNDNSIKTFLRNNFKRLFYIYTYEVPLNKRYEIEKKIIVKNSSKVKIENKDMSLINECLKKYAIFNSRNKNYLNWRYSSNYHNYKISRIFFNKELVALSIVKFYSKDNSICICEIFFKDSNKNLYTIIKSSILNFKKNKPIIMKIWSMPYFNFHKDLLNFGFKKSTFKTNVCSHKNLSKGKSFKKIYLSMGDSDIY